MSGIKKMGVIIKSIAVSYGISILLMMVYALLLADTNIPESSIPVATLMITLMSVMMGSSLAMVKIKEKGLMNGGMVGLIYILVLFFLSSIFVTGFGLKGIAWEMIVLTIVAGMVGGIVGVNLTIYSKK